MTLNNYKYSLFKAVLGSKNTQRKKQQHLSLGRIKFHYTTINYEGYLITSIFTCNLNTTNIVKEKNKKPLNTILKLIVFLLLLINFYFTKNVNLSLTPLTQHTVNLYLDQLYLSPEVYNSTKTLLNYAFSNFKLI